MGLPAERKEIKTLSDCTDQQKKFIQALCSHEIVEVPRRNRFRWAADIAGYSKETAISSVLGPIQHLIVQATEKVLMEASLEAAWTVREALDGDVDANTKTRIMAAQDILDRSVGKRQQDGSRGANNPPLAVLILPAKQASQVLDAVDENVPTDSHL
jgi:hypothetical protein